MSFFFRNAQSQVEKTAYSWREPFLQDYCVSDIEHHKALAEKHYKTVKSVQCISDYNMAVDNLSNLYDNVMNAQELEDEVKASLKKLKESETTLKQNLKQVQDKMSELRKEIERAENRMLLCKQKCRK